MVVGVAVASTRTKGASATGEVVEEEALEGTEPEAAIEETEEVVVAVDVVILGESPHFFSSIAEGPAHCAK